MLILFYHRRCHHYRVVLGARGVAFICFDKRVRVNGIAIRNDFGYLGNFGAVKAFLRFERTLNNFFVCFLFYNFHFFYIINNIGESLYRPVIIVYQFKLSRYLDETMFVLGAYDVDTYLEMVLH